MENYRWLNDYSLAFLQRGYLLEGQTVDERVDIICNRAEEILGFKGFAEKFKENFKKGWYSFSTPVWSNFGTDRGLPISCVVGETSITLDGEIKRADEIKVGDMVLTHTGLYQKVLNVIVTKKKQVYKLRTKNSFLYVTGDHLVLLYGGEWCRVDALTPEDKVCFRDVNTPEKIYSVELTDRVETVYDFTVDVDHSFVANNIIVHNCFSSYLADDIASILYTNAEVGMMTKHGGGTSGYFGALRERGAAITNNGESSGPVHFMQMFDKTMSVISQGSCVSDDTEVLTDNGFKLFSEVNESDKIAQVLSDGSIEYTDNYSLVKRLDENGSILHFKEYSLCEEGKVLLECMVTPDHDMVIFKQDGYGEIQEKVKAADLIPGDAYLMKSLDGYHDGRNITINYIEYSGWVYCANVPSGVIVTRYNSSTLITGNCRRGNFAAYLDVSHPDIMEFLDIREEGNPIQDMSYGVCISDDWFQSMIDGDSDKRKIWARILQRRYEVGYPYIFFTDNVNKGAPEVYREKGMKIHGSNLCCVTGDQLVVTDKGLKTVKELYEKGEELVLFDGEKPVKASPMMLISPEEDVFTIELNNGMTHTVTATHKIKTDRGMIELKDLKVGDLALIQSSPSPWCDLDPLVETKYRGFLYFVLDRAKRTQIELLNHGIQTCIYEDEKDVYGLKDFKSDYVEIISITPAGREPVYCCEVYTEDHAWVCNGFVTHNSEICLPTNEDESFVCNLSSMNILYYDEWKNTDAVKLLVYFLDAVMTEFIDKTENIPFMDRARNFAIRHRALGLGWLGWHSYLQSKMIPWESMEAKLENVKIAKYIKDQCYMASEELATIFGEPEVMKGYGRRNSTTCVSGDTKILTDKGYVEIKDVVGKNINVWNGFEFSDVEPYETGENDLYEVILSNGMSLKCTPDHIFMVATPQNNLLEFGKKGIVDVEASRLRPGDCLPKFLFPVIDAGPVLEMAYTNGAFSGDGSYSESRKGQKKRKEIRLYGDKMSLKDRIDWKSFPRVQKNGNECIRGYLPNELMEKHFVPINYNLESKLKWLAGIIDTDGSSGSNGVSISTSVHSFALEISFMLHTMGIHPYITNVKRTGGYSSKNEYYYIVSITSHGCSILNDLGIDTGRVNIPKGKLTVKDCPNNKYVYVKSVEKLNKKEMTYCFTEKKRGTGIFNGIYTKQCAIAPTKSSAQILGQVSEGIEPLKSNYHVNDLAKIKITYRNPYLDKLLTEKGKNTEEVWRSILLNSGSVQHLDFLSEHEKNVFKTFQEISPKEIVIQAAQRQKYIDQSQSLNLMIHPSVPVKDLNQLMIFAWEQGIKTFYYQHSVNAAQELFKRNINECESCE